MANHATRREFLKISASSALAGSAMATAALGDEPPLAAAPPLGPGPLPIQKGVLISMLPHQLSYVERFRLARAAGFAVIQAQTISDPAEAEAIRRAAREAGIPIDSVENLGHWRYPFSSADPAVAEQGMEIARTSLRNAKLWGAGAVLMVAGVVNPETRYEEAWQRSVPRIRELAKLAEQLRVVIALEEVWSKFLLSPLEMARYIDQFHSPWVRSWFDVGNVVLYGYPQDWIRTLGSRIARLHVKDFKLTGNCYHWVNLGEGAVDWPAVREALRAVGFRGSATCELPAGDAAYLRDVSSRMSRLIVGADTA